MSFLQPLGLGLLALIPIIIVLHMLRIRRQQQRVPSLMFWSQAMRETRQQPRLDRPPLTLLLLLQLLIAIAAALALSRPTVPGVLAGNDQPVSHTLILLDASASMQATDVTPSRFEAARTQAETLIADLAPASSVTLIRLGATPEVLYTGDDYGLARAALDRTKPSAGSANLREGVRLASALIKPGMRNRLVVLSDMTFGPGNTDLRVLGQIPASVELIPLGKSVGNQAITLLSARAVPGANNRFQLFARVANFSDEPSTPVARVLVDGLTIEPRQLRLAAGAQVDLRWDLPPGASRVEVRLANSDLLPADDTAQLILPAPSARRILLVSQQPDTLQRALAAIPGTEVVVVAPKAYQPDPAAVVTVFEGVLPEQLPRGAVLAIHPPATSALFPSDGQSPDTAITRLHPTSPLLAAVDLSSVTIAQSERLKLPPWATEIVGANAGPLIVAGTYQDTPIVVLSFALQDSNLPSRVSFPILMANIIDDLAPDAVPPVVEPGQPIAFRVSPLIDTITIQQPDGAAQRFAGSETVVYADTEEWGRYTITETPASGSAPRERFFTVNAGSDIESDLRAPRQPLITAAPLGQVASGPVPGREIWPLLSILALGLLLVEWWVAHR